MNAHTDAHTEPFVPASAHVIDCGGRAATREWVLLGVLNGLVVGLSHLIFSLYLLAGPGAIVLGIYHQCFENMLIASVYLLMALSAPRRWPFTINGMVWGLVGLMMGWWPILPVAAPAGFIVDLIVRRAVPRGRLGWLTVGFAFYSTMLCAANFWPFWLARHADVVQRQIEMYPAMVQMIEKLTAPVMISQLASAFVTGLLGAHLALRLIAKRFVFDRESPC
ncbi:Conserved hypothetical CHP02185 integral membrane family protein [Desulfarculus baarsii DSM 2075]|uniref:Conserved hypothetical CHP02185 integral membrane family protein n=1 Tax=Desulfarculus baarsii (strain ATCC 33931 / DSM 2075 / LMG 7858 / VKM B-1802 / 2st14) TaxID=644282 RepID=E1QGJ3_DESB2|nr:MptD family putative ECF transporter S component [Desulfarculus baarsii]ADK84686.1 Conserved hypothetical CHP02185 integral membrane family protein [Desulfarculus baarsii DSM 2075]